MTLERVNTIYFLGIGGIGMSAMARFFLLQGKQVYGYDLTQTEITSQLMEEGAYIHFDEDVNKIPESIDVVVYTPAIPMEHTEYQYFIERKTPMFKRAEILGMICDNYPTIAVAGTHGKTTTTAMITQMLMQKAESRKQNLTVLPSYGLVVLSFIGGIAKNFNSNFVCEDGFDTVIAEADEYDRSFLSLHPQIAVITSMDADHLDIYKSHEHLKTSFQLFANQIQPNGALIIYDEIADQIAHPHKVTYGFTANADYKITNIQYFADKTVLGFLYKLPRPSGTPSKFEGDVLPLTINVPGKHNALNAVAAFATCYEYLAWKNGGVVDVQLLQTSVAGFIGVKRRFDVRIQRDDLVYIDDYAHHPEEIKAFLNAVKKSYPTKKLTGIFQPHLYSRTRDFAKEFAEALEILDEIILLDIYPEREKPIEVIT
jgi:UDP-N-acetylmuramate--alanine ligase